MQSLQHKQRARTDQHPWLALGKLYLFFLYFSGLYQGFLFATGAAGFTGFRQALLMSVMWLVPVLLWPRYTRTYCAFVGTMLYLTSLVSLGYFAIYHQEFSQSVMFIAFESNAAESREFFSMYFHWWMVGAALAYGIAPLLLWRTLGPVTFPQRTSTALASVFLLITGWPFWGQLLIDRVKTADALEHIQTRMEPVAPWHLVFGYTKYRSQLAAVSDMLSEKNRLPPLHNFHDKNADKNATIVLVIGESTNRNRMGLYGYARDTSPKLNAIKDQLTIFDNVVTPRPATIEALEQVLTFSNEQHPMQYQESASIINMMKQAGYKTYWITNQQTLTERNTLLTAFSKEADEQVYLNQNRMQDSMQYDEVVLAPFAKILTDDTPRKFIVVHLLGTHMNYKYRYPDKFNYFTDQQGAPDWLNNKQLNQYNAYDNAVRYNDYILSEMINTFSATDPHGFLLYLSDHGEEVFDSPTNPFAGRNEAAPTSAMYTIPFLVWTSPRWKAKHNIKQIADYTHRFYSSAALIHTWADLCGLEFSELDLHKSMVSANYTPGPIWIGNPIDPKNLRDLTSNPLMH